MTSNPFFALLLFFSISLLSTVIADYYCGVALTTGHDPYRYYEDNTRHMLWHLKTRGVNYIQVSAYARQIGVNSTKIHGTTDRYALAHLFRLARRVGLGVFFKPVIELSSSSGEHIWRGRIKGSVTWFEKVLTPHMIDMAKLAESEGVQLLAVGSEYRAAVNKTESWIKLIKQIRKVYNGKLTYIGNHDSYWHVKFWKHLDYISISAYYRLVKHEKARVPNLNQTKAMFQVRASKLAKWRRKTNLTHLKVLVAEVGYQSKGGITNYYEPWEWTADQPFDKIMQSKMYEAFMSVFMSKPWSVGVMIWNYELDFNAGKTWAIRGFTPQNKPAQWVMKRHFKKYCH